MEKRAPIVVVLGHVDHGKTTLLDSLRKSKIADREAGGITQSIGASIVNSKEGSITFIDTPGHAAFTKMRSRGANIADIAILVVAADDGVKPQTKEVIQAIKKAQIPFIVALTKTDLPSSNPESAKASLEKVGVLFEGRGGDTPVVEVSAKKDKGLESLLEMIHLVSEVNELQGDPKGDLQAVIIETNKDKRGSVVSAVVQNGELKIGDNIYAGNLKAKVKGLFDHNNKPIKSVSLSDPVLILGFSDLPEVGTLVTSIPGSDIKTSDKKSITKTVSEDQLGLVVKADSTGSLEAILASLPKDAIVTHSGVGEVIESDIFLAKSSDSTIISYNSKVRNQIKKLADTEGLKIIESKIIYEIIETIEKLLKDEDKEVAGKATILAEFPFSSKRVAGGKVLEGELNKNNPLFLYRDKKELGEVKILSLKREKQELDVAKQGEEFGVLFEPQLDFQVGDMLVSAKL